MDSAALGRFADLAVEFGANVQPGQIVSIGAAIGQESVVRAVAEKAYRRGARFVDPLYFDPLVKRIRIEHAVEETLDFVPHWYGDRVLALGEAEAAVIALSPRVPPDLLSGLDATRAGRDQLPQLKELTRVINDRTVNWTVVPVPSTEWAVLAHPELGPQAALERLEQEVAHVCRLDEADPVASWESRMDLLASVSQRLTERRFDAMHLEGPGTDLTVGLLPSSSWLTARFSTKHGLEHMVNIPSEEIFTTPDPERVDGVVRSTKPLSLGGTLVDGLTVRFEGGRAVGIHAEQGEEALRGYAAKDEGAARLGELALVDSESRVGRAGTVFSDTLLDENAASHIALGQAYAFPVGDDDSGRINTSQIHVDFMIGSDEVAVTGLTAAGERLPVLRDGAWAI